MILANFLFWIQGFCKTPFLVFLVGFAGLLPSIFWDFPEIKHQCHFASRASHISAIVLDTGRLFAFPNLLFHSSRSSINWNATSNDALTVFSLTRLKIANLLPLLRLTAYRRPFRRSLAHRFARHLQRSSSTLALRRLNRPGFLVELADQLVQIARFHSPERQILVPCSLSVFVLANS